MVIHVLNPRLTCDEEIMGQSHIHIPNVFGNERKQNLLIRPIVERSGKHIKKEKECYLTPIGQGDIFRMDVPPVLPSQEGG